MNRLSQIKGLFPNAITFMCPTVGDRVQELHIEIALLSVEGHIV